MLYVMTLDWQPGLTREERDGALVRRAQWEYPEGLKVLGEYWTAAESPAVLVVFEADSYGPIMELGLTWGDAFRITTFPAVTAVSGLQLGAEALARRSV